MRFLLPMLGLSYLPNEQLLLLAAMAAVGAFVIGWLADVILDEASFGIIMNGLIVVAGAALGFMLWIRIGYPVSGNKLHVTALVTATSGVLLLVSLGISRRFV